MTTTTHAYRTAILEHASHLDLLLASYDALAQDCRLAGLAVSKGDIAERCRLSGHALALLGHLESWTPLLQEPALESSLTAFYNFMRQELLRSQNTPTADQFANLALTVCEVRAAWHGKRSPSATVQEPASQALPFTAESGKSQTRLSFSA